LYDPGKTALLSVEGVIKLVLALGATVDEGASVELDTSAFLVLAAAAAATRDGLRCILLSKILFCCTSKKRHQQKNNNLISSLLARTLKRVSLQHGVRVEIKFGYLRLSVRCYKQRIDVSAFFV
jgi:hypothetical protein